MDLNSYLAEKKQLVEKSLDELIVNSKEIPVITEAMRYSLLAGGKRLRPILAIMSCELFGGDTRKVLPFACSIEMIHTYSLIHDDLPAMDNDDFRRRKPTNHKVYGEGFAVLAGDALLNQAFETMASEIANNPGFEMIKAMETISRASGISGMIGGQCIDLYYENRDIDLETLKGMHSRKTGALIAASLSVGALIAKAESVDVANIHEFGKLIGLAFQVEDDILDIIGTVDKLGKSTKKDSSHKKSNFISFYGLERSKQIAVEIINEAKTRIACYGEKGYYLSELADYIINRDN